MKEQINIECNVLGVLTDISGRVRVLQSRNHMTVAGLGWLINSGFRDLNGITGRAATDSFMAVLGTGVYTPALQEVITPLDTIKKNLAPAGSPASYNNGLLQMTSETWSTAELPNTVAPITNVGVEIGGDIALNVAPFTFTPDGTQTLTLVFRFHIRGG